MIGKLSIKQAMRTIEPSVHHCIICLKMTEMSKEKLTEDTLSLKPSMFDRILKNEKFSSKNSILEFDRMQQKSRLLLVAPLNLES